VKIKGTCRRCGREFLVEQILENGGRCPWDGQPLKPDYTATLLGALRQAEESGSALEEALDRVADLRPAFVLDEASILGPLRAGIERLEATPTP
jgi:hypothetical protein